MLKQKIFFNRLRLDARIGILEHELRATQIIYIDAELDVNLPQEADDNDIRTAFSDCDAVGIEFIADRA
jgi:dihydroneopterin aldolase